MNKLIAALYWIGDTVVDLAARLDIRWTGADRHTRAESLRYRADFIEAFDERTSKLRVTPDMIRDSRVVRYWTVEN